MITKRPISNIWYGSSEFLQMHLDKLVQQGDLLFYAFVYHFKEEDEKKDHIHLYIVPNGKIDTDQLTNLIEEYDLTNVKPIRLLPFDFSKFGDWYLYTSHNIAYLASKGQTRKYHYKDTDFITSSWEYFQELIHQIDMSKINRLETIRRAVESGQPFSSLVKSGQVPIQLINQYQKAYNLMLGAVNKTYRGDYEGHEEEEIIERRFNNEN